ncbi:hypothetical protein DDZ18_12800 [Marinicauda salina]|uniref:Glycerophosphoryl diester phosphodiesterase membrane domain-containing protein n=1 Tax=Marinicauda salina TaxID=2135793 RepID=A0A2U2BRL3_9PROT|nr:hypothetical protein [Marinicauda salina]PWE16635.1 hypothetical protein DDZ18_12800 [Marinicauda salina]
MNSGASPATVRFNALRAVFFFLDLFRKRPVSFVWLSVYHVAAYAAVALASVAAVGLYGPEYADALVALEEDPGVASGVEMAAAEVRYSIATTLASLASMLVLLFVEAAWLRLMVRGEVRIAPRWGDEGRVFLAGLVIGGLIGIAGLFGFVVNLFVIGIAAAAGGALAAAIVGVFVSAGLAGLLVWLGVRLSPLAALSLLRRRFAFGEAFAGTAGIFWPLMGAWFVATLAWCVLGAAAFLAVLSAPGPLGDAYLSGFRFDDPTAPLRAYAAALESREALRLTAVAAVVMQLVQLPAVLAWRGIGARAALAIAARRDAAPVTEEASDA